MSFAYLTTRYRVRGIPGHPGHFADSLGVIWRANPLRGLVPLWVYPIRYPRVMINGQSIRVHGLVASAFLGPKPGAARLCRHLNDAKADNRPENLAWGTDLDNEADYRRLNGRNRAGTSFLSSDVRLELIEKAVELIKSDMRYTDISAVTGFSLRMLHCIRVEKCPEVRRRRGRWREKKS